MGGLAGVAAGYYGGWTDRIVSRIADTIMAFPLFVLAMGIVAALGNTVQNIVLATAIINFPLYARIARAEANIRREAGFVEAARLSGNSEWRILTFQILPNVFPILVVQMSLTMGYAILNAAGLSFIGLGVRPPTPEWGIMVAEGAANIMFRRMVDRVLSRRRVDGRGVLLQSARRRLARHGRSEETRHERSAHDAQRLHAFGRRPERRIPHPLRHRARAGQCQLLPSARARPSRWSANPAPANRSPPMR